VLTKKDLIIAILLTFCLTATLFMILPTESSPAGEYDPWLDYNDDGVINIQDLFAMGKAFGTSGDPTKNVNVTNWETDCYHRYSVNMIADIANASAGNTEPVTLYVHVTYQGRPIRNLISDNFHTCSVAGPLGAHPSGPSISFKEAATCDGVYKVEAVPFIGQQWAAGTYVFYIGVYVPAPPEITVYDGVAMFSFTL